MGIVASAAGDGVVTSDDDVSVVVVHSKGSSVGAPISETVPVVGKTVVGAFELGATVGALVGGVHSTAPPSAVVQRHTLCVYCNISLMQNFVEIAKGLLSTIRCHVWQLFLSGSPS